MSNLFKRMLGIKDDLIPVEQMSDEDQFANMIADNIDADFEKWIVAELSHIIGKTAAEKVKDADFDSVLLLQQRGLYLRRGVTQRERGATFHFKLCTRVKGKEKKLSEFKYELDIPEEPKETGL